MKMAQNGLRRPTTEAPTTQSPDTDRTFRLLADDERRTLLGLLLDEGTSTVDSLRDCIADDDEDTRHADIRLHHIHLPKLADAGLVDHDADEALVTPTTQGRDVAATIAD